MRDLCVVSVAAEPASNPWGGIGSAVGLMARALRQAGGQLIECVPGVDSAGDRVGLTLDGGGTGANPVYSAPDRSQLTLRDWDRVGCTVRGIARGQPRLVLVQNEELALVGAAIADGLGIPQVQCLHGGVREEHGGRPDTLRAEADSLRLARAHVAFSATRAEELTSLLGIRCGYLPLPLALLADEARLGGDAGPGAARRVPGLVFAAGRAVPQKNLRVMASVARHLDVRFRVEVALGHGDARHTETLQACLRTAPRTTVRPWLSPREVAERLQSATVLAIPSAFEPLGLIAAEAFAAGAIVVATGVGGLGELVRPPAGVSIGWHDDPDLLGRAFARAINSLPTDGSDLAAIQRAQRERLRRYPPELFCRELAAVADLAGQLPRPA